MGTGTFPNVWDRDRAILLSGAVIRFFEIIDSGTGSAMHGQRIPNKPNLTLNLHSKAARLGGLAPTRQRPSPSFHRFSYKPNTSGVLVDPNGIATSETRYFIASIPPLNNPILLVGAVNKQWQLCLDTFLSVLAYEDCLRYARGGPFVRHIVRMPLSCFLSCGY